MGHHSDSGCMQLQCDMNEMYLSICTELYTELGLGAGHVTKLTYACTCTSQSSFTSVIILSE